MRDRTEPKAPGTIKIAVFFVIVAFIVTNTLKAVLDVLVTTYDRIADSRQSRRA